MKKHILVLDLDETLLHTNNNGKTISRPGLQKFIKELSKHMYLVIYTAALKSYADELLKKYDIHQYFISKLYRNSCITIDNNYSKDLKIVIKKLLHDKLNNKNNIPLSLLINNKQLSLNSIIFIDNLSQNCILQPNNCIIIKDYIGQNNDNALQNITKFLLNIRKYSGNNVSQYIPKHIHKITKFTKNK